MRVRLPALVAVLLQAAGCGVALAQGVAISSGSGFIVSRSGEILTNFHVVKGCSSLTVQIGNDSTEKAELIARDETNDLAIIRINAAVNPAGAFRESPPIRAGEHVIALGYPLSGFLASTANLSEGIISALAGLYDDFRYIQISAPVQPGNSGGPLLDTSGHIIGIVSGKLDAMRVQNYTGDISQNVNFAIKGDVAKAFLDSRGIKYETARSEKQLSAADVGDQARPFTAYVECRNNPPKMPTAEKVPRPPEASSLLQTISAFLWAVGSSVNCGVPEKTYSLQIASDSIVWRSGVGNTDVESINFNSENQAQTTTIRSDHRTGRGETPGTTWSYTRVGPDRVQVAPGGKSPFMLARCR